MRDFAEFHPDAASSIDAASAKLADGQLVLARSYQASSWSRLVQVVDLVRAIWDVTLLSWGRRFHARIFVSDPAMRLIERAGGGE